MSYTIGFQGSWLQRIGVALALLAGSILVGNDYRAQAQTTGTTIVVNTTYDAADIDPTDGVCRAPTKGGQCTLRAAIQTANLLPASQHPVTVELPNGTYTLRVKGASENNAATGDLDIKVPMILTAPWDGSSVATISATGLGDRVLDILAGSTTKMDVELRRLTIRDGDTTSSGGGIRASKGARLSLSLVRVLSNHAFSSGGGIYAQDDVFLAGSEVAHNRTTSVNGYGGGGIAGHDRIDVSYSAIMYNQSAADGGGIMLLNPENLPVGRLDLDESTLANNTAAKRGGGVFAQTHYATFYNSTISGNAAAQGGGIHVRARQAYSVTYPIETELSRSAVVSNRATAGSAGIETEMLGLPSMPVKAMSTYFHGNITLDHNANCSGNVKFTGDSAGNISSDATCALAPSAGKINTQAQVGPLRYFYQQLWAHEPFVGSPLIDGAVGAPCEGRDILSTERPQGAACDIGPLEIKPGQAITPTPSRTPSPTLSPTPSPTRTPTRTPGPKGTATPVTPEPPMPPMPTFAEQ